MLCLFLIGRGSRQTELKLTKSQFEKKYNRREDLVYYEYIDPEFKSVLREKTSRKMDSGWSKETLRSWSGIIPFRENKFGCNPGRVFEIYLSLLNPDNEMIMQLPRKPTRKFQGMLTLSQTKYDKVDFPLILLPPFPQTYYRLFALKNIIESKLFFLKKKAQFSSVICF